MKLENIKVGKTYQLARGPMSGARVRITSTNGKSKGHSYPVTWILKVTRGTLRGSCIPSHIVEVRS